jgi:hypothetical protein
MSVSVNIWKASTLVLAGALVLVVSGTGIQPTQACDVDDANFAQVDFSRQNLRAAFGLLDRTRDQLTEVQPSIHRTRAIEHVQLAMSEVKKASTVQQKPRPKPRPMVKAKIIGFDE